MASTSRVQEDSELPSTSQSLQRNSFSIKNILNLSDEPAVEPVVASNEAILPIPQFPLVPHVVRPLAHNINGGVSFLYGPTHWLGSVQEFLPCPFASRFSRYFTGATPYLRRRRPVRKRKQRPLFSQQQVQTMEREFAKHRYVTEQRRSELAARLNLTETQVKTWFQNRRTKWRKESRDELETALMESKRRWKETAEESDKSGETTTASSSTENSSVPVIASQQSSLFIDLDNFKLKLSKKV